MSSTSVKHLYNAARLAGFPIAMIAGDDITWSENMPTKATIKQINLEAYRAEVSQAVLGQIASLGQALVAKYPSTEQLGWDRKAREAQAVVDGSLPEKDAMQLGIEASIVGETVTDLAVATLAAAQLTGMIPAITAGLRRKLAVAIIAATTKAELDALRAGADQLREAIMTTFASGDTAAIKAVLAGVP